MPPRPITGLSVVLLCIVALASCAKYALGGKLNLVGYNQEPTEESADSNSLFSSTNVPPAAKNRSKALFIILTLSLLLVVAIIVAVVVLLLSDKICICCHPNVNAQEKDPLLNNFSSKLEETQLLQKCTNYSS